MASNEIRFDYQQHGERDVFEIVPCIDATPLTEMIDTFETDTGKKPAGNAYGGLIPQFFQFGPVEDHFHGRSTDAMGPKTPVLGCECGEWGCWPLMTSITVTAELVTWVSFEQPHARLATTRHSARSGSTATNTTTRCGP